MGNNLHALGMNPIFAQVTHSSPDLSRGYSQTFHRFLDPVKFAKKIAIRCLQKRNES